MIKRLFKFTPFIMVSVLATMLDLISKHIVFANFKAIIFVPVFLFSTAISDLDSKIGPNGGIGPHTAEKIRQNLSQQGKISIHQAIMENFGNPNQYWINSARERFLLIRQADTVKVYASKEKIGHQYKMISPYLFVPIARYQVIIPDFFSFRAAFNRGAVWSIFQGRVTMLTVISALAIVFIIGLVFYKDYPLSYQISLGCICSGAIGNLWDRLCYGGVRDFLDMYVGRWHWPTYNIADSFIIIGILCFMFLEWKNPIKEQKPANKAQPKD